jgi:hypothetical protein
LLPIHATRLNFVDALLSFHSFSSISFSVAGSFLFSSSCLLLSSLSSCFPPFLLPCWLFPTFLFCFNYPANC